MTDVFLTKLTYSVCQAPILASEPIEGRPKRFGGNSAVKALLAGTVRSDTYLDAPFGLVKRVFTDPGR